jgi:predicted nucleotidyltransferase
MYVIDNALQKIVSMVKEDKRIKGLWAVGSVATGKTDEYSDLDLYMLVEKQDYPQVFEERASFARKLGEVLSSFEVEWPNCQLYGVILENCLEVDLCYCKLEQVEIFGPFRILYDRDGDLDQLLSKRLSHCEVDVRKELNENLDLAAYNALHAINMLRRGELWSSIRQVETLRKRIVTLIGLRTHTDVAEEYRRLESIAGETEKLYLQKTLCGYDSKLLKHSIEAAIILFMNKARALCQEQNMTFPASRFDKLLQHLAEAP